MMSAKRMSSRGLSGLSSRSVAWLTALNHGKKLRSKSSDYLPLAGLDGFNLPTALFASGHFKSRKTISGRSSRRQAALRCAGLLHRSRSARSAIVDRPRIESLIADGAVTMIDDRLSISDGAEFLVRSVASAFDAHLAHSAATHSRAV